MKKRITALLFAALISAMSVMPAFAAEEIYSGTDSYDLSKVEADGNKDNSGLATFGPIASIDNPFYGEDTSDGITIKFNVSDVDAVAKLGTILAFVDDTEAQRMWITPALYFGYNDGTKYVDANITSGYGMVADYIDGRDCEITFILTTDGFEMYVDDIKCYDQSVLEGDDTGVSGLVGGAKQTFSSYNFILNMLAKKATQLQVGSGSFWHAVGYDEAQMTVSDIRCYLGVLKPGSSTDSTAVTDANGATVAVQQVTTAATSESTGLNPMVIAIFVVVIVIIIAVAVVAVVLKNNKNNNN